MFSSPTYEMSLAFTITNVPKMLTDRPSKEAEKARDKKSQRERMIKQKERLQGISNCEQRQRTNI